MKVSYNWLQKYFSTPLPPTREVIEALTFHSFEVEGVEKAGDDYIINIDILPNRSSDCLSHRGIAKELSVILDLPLKGDALREKITLTPTTESLSVAILDEKLCRRFSGAVIEGVRVGPSPAWLSDTLERLGQKSINAVVDATNYIMFDLGQPLHAFDAGKLQKEDNTWLVEVRTARKGEQVTTLTGETRELPEHVLLITDGKSGKALSIAGIKGGSEAEITEATTTIIIEAANFNPTNIRSSSRSLKLRTDASARFENEPPIELTEVALKAVVDLIVKVAGGRCLGFVDIYPRQALPYKVGVSLDEVNRLLGSFVTEKDMVNILTRFGFEYKKVKPLDVVLALAPTLIGTPYKFFSSLTYDGTKTFDCSSFTRHLFLEGGIAIPRVSVDQYVYGEEVAEADMRPGDVVFSVGSDVSKVHHETIRYMPGQKVPVGVSHCGLYVGDGNVIHASGNRGEVILEELKDSPDFKNIVGYRRMAPDNYERYVVIVPYERLDLRIKEDLIEEIGRIYGYEKMRPAEVPDVAHPAQIDRRHFYAERVRSLLVREGFSEVYTPSFGDRGEVRLKNALAEDKSWLRQNIGENIERSLFLNEKNADLLGLSQIKIFELGTVFTNVGEYVSLTFGVKNIGKHKDKEKDIIENIVDLLSKECGARLEGEIKNSVFEVNFSEYIEKLQSPSTTTYEKEKQDAMKMLYKPISPYPFVLRDIALWVPKVTAESDVQSIIDTTAGDLLVRRKLFDVFEQGEKKSFAFRLVFQSMERTLSDEEVNVIIEKLTKALHNRSFEVR